MSIDIKLLFSSQILLQLTLDRTENAIKKSTVELPLYTDQRTQLTEHKRTTRNGDVNNHNDEQHL